jgi:hypothetical protein
LNEKMDLNILISQLNHDVQNEMKAGNVLWDEIIDAGLRYVHTLRAYLAAQALFVDRLSKLSNYSAGSGLNDLATVLGDLIQLEKNCAHSQATKASALDGVIQPLSERVIEWRKQTRKRDESPSITSSLASPSRRLLRKGSSTENLINKMGSVMTLSRKSRKPSRDRKDSSKETEMVSRETLEASVTESQARITIFVRSMTPYVQSHVEISKSTKEFSQLSFVKATQINQNQINQWIDIRLQEMRNPQMNGINNHHGYGFDSLRRHNRKSSISSISSSKSDSNSSGSVKLGEEINLKKGVLNRIANEHTEYRLSTTSHDSGFTSHDQQPINGSDDNNNENNMNHDRAIMRGRSASWKDWPKNGPYDSQLSIHRVPPNEHQNQQNDQFNLPAPPPELLMGPSVPISEPLNISCPNLESESPLLSPSRSSTSERSSVSIPLSPYSNGSYPINHHPMSHQSPQNGCYPMSNQYQANGMHQPGWHHNSRGKNFRLNYSN